MKYFFASDIHGDFEATKRILAAFARSGADKLCLLGDILYHGPRNPLPEGYNPRGVIEALNPLSHRILAVKGNCDAEVDEMVLHFPLTAGVLTLPLDGGAMAHLTHGHHVKEETPPPMAAGDVLVHGHTHVAGVTHTVDGHICLNPGSVSLPKENTPACYMIYEAGVFTFYRLSDDSVFATYAL